MIFICSSQGIKTACSLLSIMESVPSKSRAFTDNCITDICFVSHMLFGRNICSDFNIIFKYRQDYNLILNEKVCQNCGNKCRMDHNKHAFRCDRSVVIR